MEAELDRQIEAQLASADIDNIMNDARVRYGEPMGMAGITSGRPGMGGMGTMPSTMDPYSRYGEPGGAPIDMNGIQLKENGELDIDNKDIKGAIDDVLAEDVF